MLKSLMRKRKANQVREGAKALREGALQSSSKKKAGQKENVEQNIAPEKENINIENATIIPAIADSEITRIMPEEIGQQADLIPQLVIDTQKKAPELKLEQQEIPKKNPAVKVSELELQQPRLIKKMPALKREQNSIIPQIQIFKNEIFKPENQFVVPEITVPVAQTKEIKAENREPAARENVVIIANPQVQKSPVAENKPRLVAGSKGLQALNLGKSYGGKPAVRDVSITIHRGEAVGLLGPNGAGKTTSFYMIMGLVRPDYGTISLDGNDITKLPVYRRARLGVGYLPQEASIFRGLTVEENILAVLELIENAPEIRQIKLEELLGEFSISHLRRTPAIALSGGERRRVEIARALASNPSFILLDEPLAGIDPVAVNDIKELISHLKDRGIGVLITDHNVREALDLLDRAYIVHNGTVLMEGTPKEIVANKEVRRVYLGEKFVL
jgi:lipopolysaccharide export system ATP-binding protein